MDPAAYACYERLNKNPDDAEALSFLWEYHGGRAEFQQLATLVEQTAGRRPDPKSSADLFFRAAELWSKNVGRADRAVANYTRAFERDPSQLGAIEAARQIYLQLGNLKLAAQLLERQLAATGDPLVRAMLLREGAELHGRLGALDTQIAWLEEVRATQADDWELLRELAGAYLTRAQSPAAQPDDATTGAALLSSLAQSVGGEHGLAFAEAALDAWPGDEAAFAIIYEAYGAQERLDDLALRQIAFVQANPTSPYTPVVRKALAEAYLAVGQIDDAIAALEPLGAADPEIARTLLGLYRDAGRAEDFSRMAGALAVDGDLPQQVRDLKDLAEIQGRSGDRAGMLDTMRRVLALDAADPEALALLEDDLRARGDYAGLRDVLAEAVRSDQCSPDMRIPRLREIAQVSLERLDDAQAALDAWREILDSVGEDPEALAGMDQVFSQQNRWEELSPVLAQRADVLPEGDVRNSVLHRLADLHRDRSGDRAAEAAALAQLWRAAPQDDGVSERLVALRRASGNLAGLVEVLRARAERSPPAAAGERWAELGVAQEASGDLHGAVNAWREASTRDPLHPHAWDETERLLRATGQHAVLYASLVERSEALSPGPERASVHARASDAARAMGDPTTALAEAERAVAMDPANDSLATSLMDSLEVLGERDRLLAFVRERAEGLPDGPARIELTRRAARAVGQTDPAGAAAVWEEVRAGARRAGVRDDAEALDALLGLAELAGDGERVAALLEEAALAAGDATTRRALRMRRARMLAEELGRVDEGVDVLEAEARGDADGALDTWEAMEALAAAHGRWERAYDALAAQVAQTQDDDDRVERAARLVSMVETEGSLGHRLIDALRVQHAADPNDLGLAQRLADLCEAAGLWSEAVTLLEELAEMEGDDEELSTLVQRIAHAADEHLDDPERAWRVLLPQVQAGDIACLGLMIAMTARRGMHVEVLPVLTDLAQRVNDAEARASLWREIAERKAQLGDAAGAVEAECEAVVSLSTELDGLDRVDALAAQAQSPARVAGAYRAALESAADATAAHDLAMRGLRAIEASGGTSEALEFALATLAKIPVDDELLDAVIRLAPGLGHDQDLYVALDRRRRSAQTDGERLGVTLRAAEVAGAVLGDQETAFQYLEQAAALAIGRKEPDEGRLADVESTARRVDATRPEIGMTAALVERLAARGDELGESEPRGGVVLLRRAAALCEGELALPEQAMALYSRAVALWPGDAESPAKLEEVATTLRRLGEVAALYDRVVDKAYDAATARSFTARRAMLLGERLGRVDEAIETYHRLTEIAPKDLGILRALQDLLERNARWQPLLVALERELEVGADRAATYRRMATIWEQHLRNTFEAKDLWKRVLKIAPDDGQARAALERLDRRAGEVVDEEPLESLDDEEIAIEDATPAPVSPPSETSPDAPEDEDPRAALFGDPLSDRPDSPPQTSGSAPPSADLAALLASTTPSSQRVNPLDRPSIDDAAAKQEGDGTHDPRAAFFDDHADEDAAEPAPEVDVSEPEPEPEPDLEHTVAFDVADDLPPEEQHAEEEHHAEGEAGHSVAQGLHAADLHDLEIETPEPPPMRPSRPPPPLPQWSAPLTPSVPPAAPAPDPMDALDALEAIDMEDSLEADFVDEVEAVDEGLSLDDLAAMVAPPSAAPRPGPLAPAPPPFPPRRDH
jgi:tetratricopeptide (TPR) repeat protein